MKSNSSLKKWWNDYCLLIVLLATALVAFSWPNNREAATPQSVSAQSVAYAALKPDPQQQCQRIELIKVGQRVWTNGNPSGERDEQFAQDVDPSNWRKLTLHAPKRNGGWADVEMLRPVSWMEERGVRAGGYVDIEVPECGIEGNAKVLGLEPCPPVSPGPGRVVTATFHHQAVWTIDIRISGLDEPIGTTPNHPFWSQTKLEFVRADQLSPGEEVLTLTGPAIVESISPRGPPEPVYNLEVQVDHVYHVAQSGVLVHNGNPCAPDVPTHEHHVFSQEYRADFEDLGIDVDQFTMNVPVNRHLEIHNDSWNWNDDWGSFFNGKPTQQGAYDFAAELIQEYGLESFLPLRPYSR
jgi:hypothetical protein